MKKLIVCDVDGTLTESRKQADEEMQELLNQINCKYYLALFSGANGFRIWKQVSKYISKQTYFTGEYSSAHIFGIDMDNVINDQKLSHEQTDYIKNVIDKLISSNEKLSKAVLHMSDYQATLYLVPPYSSEDIRNKADPDLELRKKIIKSLEPHMQDFEMRIGGKTSIDILMKGVSKKAGVDTMCKYLKLKPSDVLFIGDRCFEGGGDYMEGVYDFHNVSGPEETKKIFRELLAQDTTKGKTVAVSGYFNPIHKGHVDLFKEAKKLGERLIVIVNNDLQVKMKRSTPFMDVKERAYIIKHLKDVDDVFISIDADKTVCESLKYLKPDIFANGGDRFTDNVPEKKVCEDLGIDMKFNIGGEKKQSSSWLIKKAAKHSI